MQKNFSLLGIFFSVVLINCASQKSSTIQALSAIQLKPFGRYGLTTEKNIEMISSAVHFGFSFEGSECKIYASLQDKNSHNYLQYEIDGVYKGRIKVAGNSTDLITLTAQGAGKHSVWIYKATEAHTGPIFVQKVTARNIKPLSVKPAPLIEFIGNSITCGAAADPSEVPCGTGQYHDQHNAYMAYGPRVARELGTNYILSSVSGIGVYRNWNSSGPTMPEVYEKLDFQAQGSRSWNFSNYSPKIVSIALGTNDFSNGDGVKPRLPFDSKQFVASYVGFIRLVRSKYPEAQLALLSSAMVNGASREVLQNCLKSVKAEVDGIFPSFKPVELFFFEPMQARGCGGHPNVEDHAILASQLKGFYRKLLK